MNPNLKIRRAIRSDAAAVARIVATAFHDLDICQWLVPAPTERAAILPGYFRIVVDHALNHDTVETTADLAAVAVWLPSSAPDIPRYNARVAACGPWTPRFEALDAAMHHVHPTDRGPHDYLAFLAVTPDHQNQGLGTALLDHRHTVLDQAGRPAYLEASNSQSRKLYARCGYSDCAGTLDLPYEGERVYPMWRDAQPDKRWPRGQGALEAG